jgi:hypothetical protein
MRLANRLPNIFSLLLCIVTAIAFIALCITRLHLGLVRYFDADELIYLHWAHNVFIGSKPYLDFFFYIPPGFLWVLAPLYFFVSGVEILTVARIIAFVIYVGICIVLGSVFVARRRESTLFTNAWVFVLPGLILTLLPLPADKFLELRPDNLAMLAALLGLLWHMRAIDHGKWNGLLAGLGYGVSLMVLPKTVPQVAIAFLINAGLVLSASTAAQRAWIRMSVRMAIGLLVPFGILGLWVLAVSRNAADISTIVYSLSKLPFEVNRIGELFPMRPDLFFYPNATYYGHGGWNSGVVFNHALWIVGLVFGMWRLVTPWLRGKDNPGAWKELLVAGTFLAYIGVFLYGYPLRHAQYLIPIAVFVAYYVADLVLAGWQKLTVIGGGNIIFCIGYMALLSLAWQIRTDVAAPKYAWTNAEDKRVLQTALTMIPKDAYVLDLVGATIYFRDPYYVTGLPYGQYASFVSRPFAPLGPSLDKHETRFIYQGRLSRTNDIPVADKAYVQTHFTVDPQHPGWLQKNR